MEPFVAFIVVGHNQQVEIQNINSISFSVHRSRSNSTFLMPSMRRVTIYSPSRNHGERCYGTVPKTPPRMRFYGRWKKQKLCPAANQKARWLANRHNSWKKFGEKGNRWLLVWETPVLCIKRVSRYHTILILRTVLTVSIHTVLVLTVSTPNRQTTIFFFFSQ